MIGEHRFLHIPNESLYVRSDLCLLQLIAEFV